MRCLAQRLAPLAKLRLMMTVWWTMMATLKTMMATLRRGTVNGGNHEVDALLCGGKSKAM